MPSQYRNSNALTLSLLLGSIYFITMSIAHYFSIKVPFLFVYYDTPFYGYQDKIISFSLIAYITLFYTAAFENKVVPACLFVMLGTVLGLSNINISQDLKQLLKPNQTTYMYWFQTAFIFSYLVVLTVLYLFTSKIIPVQELYTDILKEIEQNKTKTT